MSSQPQHSQIQQVVPPTAPIDPALIAKSESPTAVILAIAILISMLISGITGLVGVIMMSRSFR
jgi:hypothetical protein